MKKTQIYRRVAELHAETINKGFLATLGTDFLALMYEAIDADPNSVLLLATDGADIIGFVAGSCGMKSVYRRMLRKWPLLLMAFGPCIVSPRRLRRLLEIACYVQNPGNHGALQPRAELLSIGVDASYRARGHAERLYKNLCIYFSDRGVNKFQIIVGEGLVPAHRFYRRMGATFTTVTEVHRGERSSVYVQSLL